MVPVNSLLSERLAVLAAINPVSIVPTASAATSSYVKITATNANLFQRYYGVVQLGDNGTGSVTVNVLKASDTSGTGATAILTATYAASNADNIVVPFDLNAVTMATSDTTKVYIAIQATIDSGSCPVSGLLLGSDGRYDPASNYNITATKSAQSA